MTDFTDQSMEEHYRVNPQNQNQLDKNGIKAKNVFLNMMVVSMGFLQFGIGMSSWGSISPSFSTMYQWNKDPENEQKTKYDSIITGICIAGAMTGAIFCEPFIKKGKMNIMLAMNALLCVSIAVCMVNSIPVICIGRFFWGITFGVFSVVCAKYNNEICPIEYKGPFGALSQLMLTFGIIIPSTMALAIPSPPDNDLYCEDPIPAGAATTDCWYIQNFWRVIWLVPVVVAIIHTLLLLCCYRHETPVYLRMQNDEQELLRVMKMYYHETEIRARLAALSANEESTNVVGPTPGYYETFFDSNINRSAWVGVGLASFQQLTGINGIIFYSGSLFDPDFAVRGTAIINVFNFLSTIIGLVLLAYAGRKTLMAVLQVFVIISMFGMWYFTPKEANPEDENTTILLTFSVVFICAFEFGPGPIVWLYISEVCNDKATSVGTVMNWFWTLIISILSPYLITNWLKYGYVWLMFSGISIIGLIFIIFMMKETKGLTELEVKNLYTKKSNNPMKNGDGQKAMKIV